MTLLHATSDLERHYRAVELPHVRKLVQAFIEEMGKEGKCIRLRSLYEQLWHAEAELTDRHSRYAKSREEDQPYIDRELIASYIPEIETRLERLKRLIRGILSEAQGRGRRDRITPEMIDRAREYPIDHLVGNGRRGNVLCIAHEEKHPSMGLKGNRARCFSCGYYGDAIDIFMRLHSVSFVEAVRMLQ